MMDRTKPEMQANSQVGFLTGICIPCMYSIFSEFKIRMTSLTLNIILLNQGYSLLHRLIPETKPMLRMCEQNLRRWREIEEESKKLKECKPIEDLLKKSPENK